MHCAIAEGLSQHGSIDLVRIEAVLGSKKVERMIKKLEHLSYNLREEP